MAYIRTVPETEATGTLAELYRRCGNPDGTVDNVMKVHSLNPESLETHFAMYRAAMHRPSPLTRAEREIVAVVVSRINGCNYCLTHHARGLERLLPEERHGLATRLAAGDTGGLTEREAAMAAFARKLTSTPQEMNEEDVRDLWGVGLDDHAVLDLAQCVGYFNYVNRIANGLGVSLGEGEGAAGQWPAQEEGN